MKKVRSFDPFPKQQVMQSGLLNDDAPPSGLSLYSGITEEPDYYLFETERELLQKHGDEIAQSMFPFLAPQKPQTPPYHQQHKTEKNNSTWGDYESGTHNYGINGALGDESPRGFIVELGAG